MQEFKCDEQLSRRVLTLIIVYEKPFRVHMGNESGRSGEIPPCALGQDLSEVG